MGVPRFMLFEGYETIDYQVSTRDSKVTIRLESKSDKPYLCHRCKTPLCGENSAHRLELKDLPLRGFETIVRLWRRKGHCPKCKKIRSEAIPFVAKESPHFTQDYAWWLGTMCEFAPVSRVAEMAKEGNMSVRRVDLKRMERMLKHYKIPEVTHIAVDEVYARKKKRHKDEDRDLRFFTIISDLATHRVIWVAESRKQQALDQFFALIGEAACKRIQVVAADQHEGYGASVRKNCPGAKLVWDRFHIMQTFGEAVNETRKNLHNWLSPKDPLVRVSRGKYRYIFLKKAERRTETERQHIDDIVKENADFSALEIIKEGMLSFFDEVDGDSARKVFVQIGDWIKQKCELTDNLHTPSSLAFEPLQKWWDNLAMGWDTLKNYFEFRVTSALAEGTNNVIKALKRRSFGFRNMDYFRLKIMQVCGYLNSRYIKFPEALGT